MKVEIVDYNYFVDKEGRVYSKGGEEKAQFVDDCGYKRVALWKNNKYKFHLVHRLVAKALIPNPENKPCVNHKDGNKQNNHVDNLEWITRSDNIKHSYIHRDPKTYKGSGNKNAKLTEEQVKNIRKEYKNNKITYKELAYKNNVGVTLIGYIVNNKVWKHV